MSQHHSPLLRTSRTSTGSLWESLMSVAEDYKAIIVPVAGNISTAYNVCNIGYVVQLIRLEHPVPRWAAPAFASSVLCGAIMGQLLLGWAGDRFGRKSALVACMIIVAIGALGSAAFVQGYGNSIWTTLVFWRFILGVGVGGTYPLTAVYAGEMNDDRGLGRTTRVALSVAMQIVGNILAPVLMFVILCLLGTERVTMMPWATETGWRFLLGAGAIPALFALKELLMSAESHEFLSARASGRRGRLEDVFAALEDPTYRKRLIGCSIGWFCFDISFFSITIFLPHIMHDLIDRNDQAQGYLLLNSAVSALINCIAIPAALLSMRVVGDEGLGRRNLQTLSFFMIAVSYFVLSTSFGNLRAMGATTSLVLLFALLFFCLNFGAQMTTYILPQESFPPDVRASLNGFAAASGKAGAVVGAYFFAPMARMHGLGTTFATCGVFAIIGLVTTLIFVDDMRKEEDGKQVLQVPSVQRNL